MSIRSLNRVERVGFIEGPNWTNLAQCFFRFVKKAVRLIPEWLTFDADALFENKDWPYFWKMK